MNGTILVKHERTPTKVIEMAGRSKRKKRSKDDSQSVVRKFW